MNLSAVNRTVILLSRLFDPTKPTRPFLPPAPPKPVFAPTAGGLVRAVPEDMGLSSRRIAALLHDLREHPGLRMHSVMILRHGAVVSVHKITVIRVIPSPPAKASSRLPSGSSAVWDVCLSTTASSTCSPTVSMPFPVCGCPL